MIAPIKQQQPLTDSTSNEERTKENKSNILLNEAYIKKNDLDQQKNDDSDRAFQEKQHPTNKGKSLQDVRVGHRGRAQQTSLIVWYLIWPVLFNNFL